MSDSHAALSLSPTPPEAREPRVRNLGACPVWRTGSGGEDPGQCGSKDAPRQCHHLGGRPVTDRKADQAPVAPARHMGHQLFPGRRRPWPGRLSDVADKGHRTRQRTAAHHAQFHRGKVLDFVDNDVAVGPVGCSFGGPGRCGPSNQLASSRRAMSALRPTDLLERRAPWPIEQVELGCAQESLTGQLDQRLGAEEVVQQGFGASTGATFFPTVRRPLAGAVVRRRPRRGERQRDGLQRVPRDLPRRCAP